MHGMLYRHTRTALVVIAATFCGATSERVHAQPVGEIAERRSDLDDLKKRIRDHVRTSGDTGWTGFLADLVDNYNKTGHSSLDDQSPDEVFADYDARMDAFLEETDENRRRRAGHPRFKAGDVVRIVLKRGTFDKEGYRLSKELYVVLGPDGSKWRVKDRATGQPLGRRTGRGRGGRWGHWSGLVRAHRAARAAIAVVPFGPS